MRGAGEEPSGSLMESAQGAFLQGGCTWPPCHGLHLWSLTINGGNMLHIDRKIRSDIMGKAFA